MKLSELEIGKQATVEKIELKPSEKGRLFTLGIAKGAVITVERYSALKSSLLARVGAVRVIMRTELADNIEVSIRQSHV